MSSRNNNPEQHNFNICLTPSEKVVKHCSQIMGFIRATNNGNKALTGSLADYNSKLITA